MTDIKEKVLALLNEVRAERGYQTLTAIYRDTYMEAEALFRALEQHEVYKQKVSDAVEATSEFLEAHGYGSSHSERQRIAEFIIPKPEPDPLVEVFNEVDADNWSTREDYVDRFRAALDALGFEIREKGQ